MVCCVRYYLQHFCILPRNCINEFVFIKHLVCPATVLSSSFKASQCVGLSRKLHSWRKCHPKHTHTHDSAQQPIILLSASLAHHLHRKIWSRLSTFTALSKALPYQIILCLHRRCISARRTCCTNIVLLWCGANSGKKHFTHDKWSKGSGCRLDLPSVRLLCCGAVCSQEKKRLSEVRFFI